MKKEKGQLNFNTRIDGLAACRAYGPGAAPGGLTLDSLDSARRKIRNILKGTFPPHQVTGCGADSVEKNQNSFGSHPPSDFPFLKNFPTMSFGQSIFGRGTGGPFTIIENHFLTIPEQYFFPRTKRRRIQKKAAKKYIRQVQDLHTVYFINNQTLVCHPILASQFRRMIKGGDFYEA